MCPCTYVCVCLCFIDAARRTASCAGFPVCLESNPTCAWSRVSVDVVKKDRCIYTSSQVMLLGEDARRIIRRILFLSENFDSSKQTRRATKRVASCLQNSSFSYRDVTL